MLKEFQLGHVVLCPSLVIGLIMYILCTFYSLENSLNSNSNISAVVEKV